MVVITDALLCGVNWRCKLFWFEGFVSRRHDAGHSHTLHPSIEVNVPTGYIRSAVSPLLG